jgi:hypothetical protein
MPCEKIMIIKSPSAKTRTKKPCIRRENGASPRKAFFDSKKTPKNTPMYLGEKSPRFEKRRENDNFRLRGISLKRKNRAWRREAMWDENEPRNRIPRLVVQFQPLRGLNFSRSASRWRGCRLEARRFDAFWSRDGRVRLRAAVRNSAHRRDRRRLASSRQAERRNS